MNTYQWKITSISTLPSPPAPIEDCAVFIEYLVTASNNDNLTITAQINGCLHFSIPSNAENLTPYADLTETQVLNWIQAEPNLVVNIQANLDGQIDSIFNPPIVPEITPLPWAIK